MLLYYDFFNFKIFLQNRMDETYSQSTPSVQKLQREHRMSSLRGRHLHCRYLDEYHLECFEPKTIRKVRIVKPYMGYSVPD